MSNNYATDTELNETNKKPEREAFLDSKTAMWAVVLSILAGLWVMFTMAAAEGVGLNWSIFVVGTIVAVAIMMHLDGNLKIVDAVFWLAAITAIGSTFLRQNDFPVLAFLFLPTAVVFFTIFAAKDSSENIIARFFYRHFAFFVHFWKLFLVKPGQKKDKPKGHVGKVMLGILISAFLLLIIVPLMFSADMMFENTVEKFFDFEWMDYFMSRLISGIVVTLLGFAFIYTVTVKKDTPQPRGDLAKRHQELSTMIITILSILSTVFLIFVVIQARFLFFQSGGKLPAGYTFMEYAVDGYWSQAALTAINLIVVLATLGLSKEATGAPKRTTNVLLTIMTALNAYMVCSAAYKMHLYENAYGFTQKRLLVYLILLMELITLGLLIYSIFKRNFPFIKTVVYLAAAYFAVVACLNLDATSVRLNLERFEESGEMDAYYMFFEAEDGIAVLQDYYIENQETMDEETKYLFVSNFADIFLHMNYEENITVTMAGTYSDKTPWYEFNLSKYRRLKISAEMYNQSSGIDIITSH